MMPAPARMAGDATERSQVMTIAALVDLAGGNQEEYDAVVRELGPAGEPAGTPGLLFHSAGPTDDGWRVIDFWESQEALDRFTQEQLMPAMQRAGVTRRPNVQVMPIHRYVM
jgi:hypothetical protein